MRLFRKRAHEPWRFENVRRLGTIAAMELKVPDPGYLAGIGPELTAFFDALGILGYIDPHLLQKLFGIRLRVCLHSNCRGNPYFTAALCVDADRLHEPDRT